ncbi:MAG: hypothetical protein FD174_2604 [Geobacteraceae bacterium]|nr:MAG: hypothetical protein FD174_2604 [Geobacteraceae bacterium]
MTQTAAVIQADKLMETVAPVKLAAMELVVSAPAHVEIARDGIREIKRRREVIDSHCDPGIKQAHQLHKQLVADKKKLTDELDEAEKIIKRKVADFQLEQERITKEAEEQARKEAEAEKQKILTAAQGKITKAMNAGNKLEEQIAALQLLIENAETTETEREMAKRQMEVLWLKLEGQQDKAAEAQRQAEIAAEAITVIPLAAIPAKTAGVSGKKVYNIVSIDAETLIKAIAEGKAPANLVKSWDEAAIKKFRGMNMAFAGVQYAEDRQVSVR